MKISIALCTYNGEQYLREQLESIAAQTRPPDELVICDDRSSDHTCEIVKEFAARAPFPVRLQINERNLGSTQNFEKAISLCQADIIALSDQDDVWLPRKLERFESLFAEFPDVGLIFTDGEIVGEDLRPLGSRLWQWTFSPQEQRLVSSGQAFDVLMQRNVVTGATMAFRSRYRQLALPIPPDFNLMLHDTWIALVVSQAAGVMALPEPLIKYRQHRGQQVGISSIKLGRENDGTAGGRTLYYARETQRLVYLSQMLQNIRTDSPAHALKLTAQRATLEELIAHYRVRGKIPTKKFQRLPLIFRELLTLRYHRHSKGMRSVIIDFLR